MNFSKNFTAHVFLTRIFCYIVYFIASAFIGKIVIMLLYPFMQYFINDSNTQIFDMVWYIINLLVMYAVMMFFISREGFADMERRCYSVVKNIFAALSAALLFFGILSFFYFFPQFTNYAYIISFYFSYEAAWYFMPDFAVFNIIPLFFIYTGAVLILSIVLTSFGYSGGRKRWIEYKRNKIEKRIAEKAARAEAERLEQIYKRR